MEQLKSNRLGQFVQLIADMVSYQDIYGYLLEDNTISFEIHNQYLEKIRKENKNNSHVMTEVVACIRKRKGGFDRFVEILRRTDYIWLAEQLDPECEYTEPQRKRNSIDSFVSSVARKSLTSFSRKSRNTNSGIEDMVETNYTTYRDSYASDISYDSKRASYGALSEKDGGTCTSSNYGENTATHSKNGNNASLDINETLNGMSMEDCDDNSKRKSVLIYNLPESNSSFMDHIMDTRQFEKVAKTLGLSSKILNGLKVIRIGKICKIKSKSNSKQSHASRPLKARFKSEEGCKLFLQSIQPHGGVINTEFGEVTVKPCDLNMSLTLPKEKVKKKHWYQIFGRGNSAL